MIAALLKVQAIFNSIKFRYKLALIFGLIMLIFIVFMGILSSQKSSEVINAETSKALILTLEQANKNIDYKMRNYERIINSVYINNSIQEALTKDNSEIYDRFLANKGINEFIQLLFNTYEDNPKIKIYSNNPLFIPNNTVTFDIKLIKDEKWFDNLLRNSGQKIYWIDRPLKILDDGISKEVIFGAKVLKDFTNHNNIGVVTIEINTIKLFDNLKNVYLGKTGYLILVDNDGKVIYGDSTLDNSSISSRSVLQHIKTGGSGSFELKLHDKDILYVYDDSNMMKWKLVGIVPQSEITISSNEVIGYIYFIAALCILVGIVIVYTLSYFVTRKINYLTACMKAVSGGNLDIDIKVKGNDELSGMSKVFKNMLAQIKELMVEKQNAIRNEHKLELKALQAQIQPHFLYNTLSSINTMVLDIEAYDISTIIVALARYYKLTLSKGADVISIAEELEHANVYIQILQKIKLKNRLSVKFNFNENLMECITVKMVLQPFVENAIFHGFDDRQGEGEIIINVFERDNKIIFEVIDNGKGISPEEILLVTHIESSGYGIKNVNSKIKLYFGNEYGVTIDSVPGSGTKVTIVIPYIKGEKKSNA